MSLWSPGAAGNGPWRHGWLRAACGAGSMPAGLSGLLLGDDLVAGPGTRRRWSAPHARRHGPCRVPLTTEAAGATWVRKRRPATGQGDAAGADVHPGPGDQLGHLRLSPPAERAVEQVPADQWASSLMDGLRRWRRRSFPAARLGGPAVPFPRRPAPPRSRRGRGPDPARCGSLARGTSSCSGACGSQRSPGSLGRPSTCCHTSTGPIAGCGAGRRDASGVHVVHSLALGLRLSKATRPPGRNAR